MKGRESIAAFAVAGLLSMPAVGAAVTYTTSWSNNRIEYETLDAGNDGNLYSAALSTWFGGDFYIPKLDPNRYTINSVDLRVSGYFNGYSTFGTNGAANAAVASFAVGDFPDHGIPIDLQFGACFPGCYSFGYKVEWSNWVFPAATVADFYGTGNHRMGIVIATEAGGGAAWCETNPEPCTNGGHYLYVETGDWTLKATFDVTDLLLGTTASIASQEEPGLTITESSTPFPSGTNYSFSQSGSPAVVPIPPAVWLFGSALGVMGWMRRKAA